MHLPMEEGIPLSANLCRIGQSTALLPHMEDRNTFPSSAFDYNHPR